MAYTSSESGPREIYVRPKVEGLHGPWNRVRVVARWPGILLP